LLKTTPITIAMITITAKIPPAIKYFFFFLFESSFEFL
jgi:hypothetical protein